MILKTLLTLAPSVLRSRSIRAENSLSEKYLKIPKNNRLVWDFELIEDSGFNRAAPLRVQPRENANGANFQRPRRHDPQL